QLAQLGLAFGLNSAFLKFSRTAERQADDWGSQIMYDTGYDPRAMAQFFEIIQKQAGSQSLEFLSDHPNPGNRIQDVSKLIPQLGPSKSFGYGNSGEFEQIKRRVSQLQANAPSNPMRSGARPPAPSRGARNFTSDYFSISYPDNWQTFGERNGTAAIVPPESIGSRQEGAPPEI